ncbi:hypothetical protein D0T50_12895 [Bacteroides sp. 214]|uniref:type IX secretion system sortase PorU n=1 Tax=Bacteroides sp. 214 TaxID=2302935 RepID=UPI0013CF72BF|nr:type IX secretion system sortase PorU [Bacteroides sp. 214]NDW13778.1 hypothetical protein [Bacteroides sp. 214]
MFVNRKIVVILLLILSLSLSAQTFLTINWKELSEVHTLPAVREQISLGKDYDSCIYKVRIEYPEFEPLTAIEAAELSKQNISLPDSPIVETQLNVSAHHGYLDVSFIPVVFRAGGYQRILSCKLAVERIPVSTRAMQTAEETTRQSVLAEGKFTKIRVKNNAVYRITYAELKRMGYTDPTKVSLYGYGGHLLSQRFDEQPATDLRQVPLLHIDESVLFYGLGPLSWKANSTNSYFTRTQNFYSEYGYYFLAEKEESPIGFPAEASLAMSTNKQEVFDAVALHEKDSYAWGATGRELYEDYDYVTGNTRTYRFTLPGIQNEPGRVIAEFAARSIDSSTTYTIAVDGQTVGTQSVSAISSSDQYYTKATSGILNANWAGDKTEQTSVTLTHNRSAGILGRLNYLILNYKRILTLNEAFVSFRSLASINRETTFVLSNANSNTVVWDVTSPTEYKQMDGTLEGDKFTFTIPAGTLREFVAVNLKATFETVEVVGNVVNQNLHGLEATDMVIIIPDNESFRVQAERLAQVHRNKDKLTVELVTASQVYNEFSSGTPDATAYRRLMKMLYDRYTSEEEKPKYLLLFGDCSYDNRLISPTWSSAKQEDFLLCYQSENSLDEVYSYVTDDYFGFLDNSEGDNLATARLDIGIGRFPVRSVAQAIVAVDKTIAYIENKQAGSWKNTICFVADDGDNNLHVGQAEKLATYAEDNYGNFMVNRIYADSYKREATATGYSYPDATNQLLKQFEKGMLIVNYVGHGSTSAWSAENLLTADHISRLESPRLPLWITATCDFTRYDDVNTSAGEQAFLNANGGAIALLTTSRVVYAAQNATLNQAFVKHLFDKSNGKRVRLGDIMRLAKCDITLSNDRNKLNFSLIGDPALTLAYPDYQIQIDEFDGALTNEYPMIKAGGKVTVKGHVLTPEGEVAEDFSGTIYPTVLDSKENVKTLDNLDEGAFRYEERGKILFSGAEPVVNGSFEFVFPVPLDINYSEEQGLMNLYAVDFTTTDVVRESGSYFDSFLVGGTAENISSDTDGPQITAYLNTADFLEEGKTNETPQFVAHLKDEDGINTVGNGIGRDLTLVIDGNPTYTYSLNEYYTPESGDYTQGTVRFSIPELPEGEHILLFRAWDLLNNSSTIQLGFEVIKGLRPELIAVTCTPSPAKESTQFLLSHNRPGSLLDITLTVYDSMGKPMWNNVVRGTSAENNYYITWNLCTSAGQRLAPGVYIYRASISSGGGKVSSKSKKIIVLGQ